MAAAVGALAGLGAYELQSRKASDKETNLNLVGSILVGALASVAGLFLFSPVAKTVVAVPGGSVKTLLQYDLVKLVSLAVIVGSGGRAFLTAFQSRAGAILSAQTSKNVVAEAPKALSDASAKIGGDAERARTPSSGDVTSSKRHRTRSHSSPSVQKLTSRMCKAASMPPPATCRAPSLQAQSRAGTPRRAAAPALKRGCSGAPSLSRRGHSRSVALTPFVRGESATSYGCAAPTPASLWPNVFTYCPI